MHAIGILATQFQRSSVTLSKQAPCVHTNMLTYYGAQAFFEGNLRSSWKLMKTSELWRFFSLEAGVFAPPPRTAPHTEEVQHTVCDSACQLLFFFVNFELILGLDI